MTLPLALIIMGLTILALLAALVYVLCMAAGERRELYNRLQAGTLQDYAVFAPTMTAEQVPAPKEPEPEAITEPWPAPPAVDVAAGRSQFESL